MDTKAEKLPTAKTVDEYFDRLPEAQLILLDGIRQTIKAAAPQAEEVISYQLPAYKQLGTLVYFAAFKNHCSLVIPSNKVVQDHWDRLKPFWASGVTFHFTPEKPFPHDLLHEIVQERIKENEAADYVKKPTKKVKKTKG